MVPFEATFGLEGSAKILHSFQCQALPIATSLPPLTHGGQTPNPARGELVSLAGAREFGQLHSSAHRRHFKRAWRRGLGAGAGQRLHGKPSKDADRRRRRPLGLWPSGETAVPRRHATQLLGVARSVAAEARRMDWKPDLVHVHVAHPAGAAAVAWAKRWGVPVVLTEHWTGYHDAKPRHGGVAARSRMR